MTCEEARIQLSAYVDDELSELERARLEAHLAQCPDCSALLQAYRDIDAGLLELSEPAPEDLARRVMDNLPEQTRPKRRRFAYGGFTAVAAVAAVLVLAIATGKLKMPRMGASSSDSTMSVSSTVVTTEEEAAPVMAESATTTMETAPASQAPTAGEIRSEEPAAPGGAPSAAYFAMEQPAEEPAEAQAELAEETAAASDALEASLFAARDMDAPAEETAAEEEAAVEETPMDGSLDTGVFAYQSNTRDENAEEAEAEPAVSEEDAYSDTDAGSAASFAPEAAGGAALEAPAPLPESVDAAAQAPVPMPEPEAAAAAEPLSEPLPTEDVFGTGQELTLQEPTNLTTDIIAQNDIAAALIITGASGGPLPEILAELIYQPLEDGPLYHEDDPETILALYEALDGQLPPGAAMSLEQTDNPYGAAYVLLLP